MPNYTTYRIGQKYISNILESSDNRWYNSSAFSGYRAANSNINFATYYAAYQPFLVDKSINSYFVNSSVNVNKGCIQIGGAPLVNQRYSYSKGGDTIIFSGSSGDGGTTNTLTRKVGSDSYYERAISFSCPSSVIVAIVGAGGGGASGGGSTQPKFSYGGGCAPVLIFNLELPFNSTNSQEILKIDFGTGGAGGDWSGTRDGSAGSTTTVYYKNTSTGNWETISFVFGGLGGKCIDSGTPASIDPNLVGQSGSMPTSIREVGFYGGFTGGSIGNGEGYGRIAINESCKSFYVDGTLFKYIPGDSYNAPGDTSSVSVNYLRYVQAARTSNRLAATDGKYYLNNSSYNSSEDYYEIFEASGHSVNFIFSGRSSIYGLGGKYSTSANITGASGGIGAGGASGGPSSSIFSNPGIGGKGGDAGVYIYW